MPGEAPSEVATEVRWVLGSAFTIILALAAGAWKISRLRDDLNRDWGERVVLVIEGLRQKAVDELVEIQRRVAVLVPGIPADFNPEIAAAEPAELLGHALAFGKYMRLYIQAPRDLRRLLALDMPWFISLLVVFAGVVLVALDSAEFLHLGPWVQVGYWAAAVGLLAALVLLGWYFFLRRRLAKADTDSSSRSSSPGGKPA